MENYSQKNFSKNYNILFDSHKSIICPKCGKILYQSDKVKHADFFKDDPKGLNEYLQSQGAILNRCKSCLIKDYQELHENKQEPDDKFVEECDRMMRYETIYWNLAIDQKLMEIANRKYNNRGEWAPGEDNF